jgi:hypothetical protein
MSKGKTEKGHQTPNTKHQTAKHSIVFLSVAFHYSSCSFSPSLSLFVNRGASFFDVHYVSLPAFLSFLYSFLYHSIAPSAPFRRFLRSTWLRSLHRLPLHPSTGLLRSAQPDSSRLYPLNLIVMTISKVRSTTLSPFPSNGHQRPPTATNGHQRPPTSSYILTGSN